MQVSRLSRPVSGRTAHTTRHGAAGPQPFISRRTRPTRPTIASASVSASHLNTIDTIAAPTSTSHPVSIPIHNATPDLHATRRALLLSSSAALSLSLPAAAPAKSPSSTSTSSSSSSDPGDWSSPGLGAPVDPSAPRFVKLPSGVRYQELNVGSGPAAAPGDAVLFDYVLRRSNGYFIYGTVEGISFQPRDVPVAPVAARLGAGELIAGLEEVLAGMAPGSKRRALIPPELGYVGGGEGPQPPTFATKRQLENHRREPLLFEVQMLRVGGRK